MIHGEFFDLSGKVSSLTRCELGRTATRARVMAANRMNAVVICFALLMPSFYIQELMTYHAKFSLAVCITQGCDV